ncbi:MAG: EI24 domain-containing protein [Burkholderiaceae bacterium]|nr:EI24 domain-containing protein [Burkholderiaceae bacterium]
MLAGMGLLLDSFWRALAYCLQPRVILLSLLPLVLVVSLTAGLFWLFWDDALVSLRSWLSDWALLDSLYRWLESVSLGHLRTVLDPLLLIMLVLPLVILLSLLAVAWLVTPAVVKRVAARRFPQLAEEQGGSFWGSVGQSLGSALLALLALVLSLPLWLIPPLVIVLPPLIWGWLTSRVMVYDTLALHASRAEREQLMQRHRYPLLAIGVVAGYMGAAPGLIWAVGAMAVVLAPLLVPLAIWIYTFVFIFASLWFTHYGLAALAALRQEPLAAPVRVLPEPEADVSTPPHA